MLEYKLPVSSRYWDEAQREAVTAGRDGHLKSYPRWRKELDHGGR